MSYAARIERSLPACFAALVAIFVVAKIMSGFEGDWRPDHFDEWRSLSWAQQFVESGELAAQQPVGSPNGLARDISDRNRSLGFVALYGAWLELAPAPIAHLKTLVGVFVLLYVGGMYALMRSLGIRAWAVLPALLAIGSIPTDPMLLGPSIAAPSSLSLGLLCFALVGHLRLTRSVLEPSAAPSNGHRAGGWVLLASTGGALALTYPLTLIVFGGLVAIDVLARPGLFRTRYVRILMGLGVLGGFLLLHSEWQSDFRTTALHFFELFLVDQSWHLKNLHEYRLDYLVLPPVLLLAIFGAGAALTNPAAHTAPAAARIDQRDAQRLGSRSGLWVAAAFVVPLLTYAGYHVFGAGWIIPYQRVGLYLNWGAILCSAVAIDQILDRLEEREIPAWASVVGIVILSAVILVSPRAAPPYEGERRRIRPEPALEEAAARIRQEFSRPSRIFTTPLEGLYLEALTGLRVAPEVLDSLLTAEPPPVLDCDAGWEIIVARNSCPQYVLVFRVDDVPVYQLRNRGGGGEQR